SERVARRGIIAVVILRILPIAPFTIVNLVAGASHIRMRDFMLGTLIGMGPGVLLTVSFAHQLVAAMRHPTPLSFAVLIGIGVALVGGSVLLQRFLGGRGQQADAPVSATPEEKARARKEAALAATYHE